MTVLDILIKYHDGFLQGLAVTLQLSLIIWIFGMGLGTALGMAGAKYKLEIGLPTRLFSFFLSGIPLLVFLFWLHYPVQAMFNVVIDPFITAAFTLTIVNIVAVADLVRTTVDDFPKQYILAARVCGMDSHKTFWRIQLPIMFRQMLPALLMLQVTMMHTTLFASLISVEEIFRVAQRINASIYKPVEIYTALGVFFLAVSLPINGFALLMKAKFTRNLSES
ncbi:MAG: ABC transporter permease subunit [Pseudomonadaceae bacterium]|nr:ABC transporter permease subunit [Pseudomonadaceae bacterium]